jgi:hypothetical protein
MGETFELERFEWQAPDRLEIAGKFHGLEQSPDATPVLVVTGNGEAHQLDSVDESVSGPPEDGKSWQAEFAWDEAPVGIEAAVLEFGRGMMIELPAPGAKHRRPRFIDVRRAEEDAAPAEDAEHDAPAEQDVARDPEASVRTPGDIALEADLVAAEARIQELRAALERAEVDLDRARADLELERTGRRQDAEQFHDGLAHVRASAEQALAAAQGEAQQLRDEVEAQRSRLDAAESARAEAESEAAALREQVAVVDGLRQRVSALEDAGADASEMRADAQRLLERLTRFAEALDAGR